MRKFLLFAIAPLLFAGEYITLENGKVIELKDDGTWQEVQVIKKDGRTIAIKPDGTWEPVEPKRVESAITEKKSDDKKRLKSDPLVQILLGRWKGEGIEYRFEPDVAMVRIREGKTHRVSEGKWVAEKIDPQKRLVVVNIGSAMRLGSVSFGGEVRRLRIMDSDTLVDETDKISGRVYTLHRVK